MNGQQRQTDLGGAASWEETLASLLPGDHGKDQAAAFAARLPAGYRERTTPEEAAFDIARLTALAAGPGAEGAVFSAPPGPPAATGRPGTPGAAMDETPPTGLPITEVAFGGHHQLAVCPAAEGDECAFRIRRYGEHGMELTRFLPVLESFGLVVVESVPYRLAPGAHGEPAVHIDDVGVRIDSPDGPETLRFVPEVHGPRLSAALDALARGETEVDSLNRLVTVAGLDWRQVSVLRAYLRYWLQGGTVLSGDDLADPLVTFPDVARALIGYFQARFDPERPRGGGVEAVADKAEESERARVLSALDLVPHLRQDQVLRGYLQLIDATLRTNYFQRDMWGRHRPALTLKLDSSLVPELPAPRPLVEAFVHGPQVEGIHLRAGLIARGGLRWSERPTDFRTEVLDLAFAQLKKNAIIVPTGAKGGFVCHGRAKPTAGSGPSPAEVQAAYETFVRALLDITDNLVGGEVVPPPSVVAIDGPDPYLVVAADKGTASFSDIANGLAAEYGFWLDDAFASGGSHGYDHKALGITAKGAWVAVRRHFHQLGIDVQTDPIRVVGVGDMSGDVFGNGMLCSESIRLIGAFDHRHVFIDPDPDPAISFAERRRLAALPKSSWADYQPELISEGGGVWPRNAKAIPLTPAARRALGVSADSLSPPEVISAILAAPADLLWFGGIGTYIKDVDEPDSAVGDHANDALRVTADQVRARVIAEGGNLGVTQRARIRYSRRGGRINTDFIDNAAGVATSDREVNMKILLKLAIEEGRLHPEDRDGFLLRSTGEVETEVLRQIDHSVGALNRAVPGSAQELDAYAALLDTLEDAGRFDRQVECLPTSDELQVRREAGAGLIRPELAVLLAYAKSDLVAAIEGSPDINDLAFADAVIPYFPAPLRDVYADLVPKHRLYPQLVATDVAGEIVDLLGIVWAHETAAELGRDLAEVAVAFWAARQVIGAASLSAELEHHSTSLSADAEAALHATIGRAVARLARAYLTTGGVFRMGEVIERDSAAADEVEASHATTSADTTKGDEDGLVAVGVDRAMASRFVAASTRAGVAEAWQAASRSGRSLADAAEMLTGLDRVAGLDRLNEAVSRALGAAPPPSRLTVWQGRALLDDVTAWRSAAAAAVLRTGGEPIDALTTWEAEHRAELGRAATLLAILGPDTPDPMAVTALVLRRLDMAL